MNVHKNARMTVHGRLLLVARIRERGWRVEDAALAAGVSLRSAYKWLARWRAGGERALHDRSSAPARCPSRLPAEVTAQIERLRRRRLTGPQIARRLRRPRSTVGLVLRRLGLGRLTALEPRPPVIRYQRASPGELLHIDTKKLGRIDGIGHRITGDRTGPRRRSGWEILHVAIDDAARLAYSEILPDERKASAIAFLDRALGWFGRHGVTVERVMTDNGSAYRSHAFRRACADAGLRHLRTRPYTPRTNGKAERFIQTALREWAYARPFASSGERSQAIVPWLHYYNHHRPHAGIHAVTPAARLNNLLGNDN
jgi:transposase InsO family protein